MFNNSTNINKIVNYLSPQAIEHKKTMTYGIGILCPDLRRVQKCGGIKPVNAITTLPLRDNSNVISNSNKM